MGGNRTHDAGIYPYAGFDLNFSGIHGNQKGRAMTARPLHTYGNLL